MRQGVSVAHKLERSPPVLDDQHTIVIAGRDLFGSEASPAAAVVYGFFILTAFASCALVLMLTKDYRARTTCGLTHSPRIKRDPHPATFNMARGGQIEHFFCAWDRVIDQSVALRALTGEQVSTALSSPSKASPSPIVSAFQFSVPLGAQAVHFRSCGKRTRAKFLSRHLRISGFPLGRFWHAAVSPKRE